jgi:AcrR family transcriptional regulator
MGKPTARKEAIRQEAVRLFVERGYSATSMRDIAKAVGLLPGSLYAHIQSKEQLLADIVEGGVDEFLGAIEPIADSDAPATVKLRAAIKAHISLVARRLTPTRVVFQQWRALTGEHLARVRTKRRRYEERIREIVQEGVDSGEFRADVDTRIAVLVILGALNWTHEWLQATGGSPADVVGDRVSDLLVAALALPAVVDLTRPPALPSERALRRVDAS